MLVSVVLPTYNERENIADLIFCKKDILQRNGFRYEIIVVDEDSPDGTWKLVESISEEIPNVRVIRRVGKRGLASAIADGVSRARGDVVIWMDCDFSHPPKLIPEMLSELREYDAVIASRYVSGGGDEAPLYRRLISLVGDAFASRILGLSIRDCTSGYIALKKSVFNYVKIRRLGTGYGEYFIALMYDLQKKGFKVKEIPYVYRMRQRGVSKTSPNLLRFVKLVLHYLQSIFVIRFKCIEA